MWCSRTSPRPSTRTSLGARIVFAAASRWRSSVSRSSQSHDRSFGWSSEPRPLYPHSAPHHLVGLLLDQGVGAVSVGIGFLAERRVQSDPLRDKGYRALPLGLIVG